MSVLFTSMFICLKNRIFCTSRMIQSTKSTESITETIIVQIMFNVIKFIELNMWIVAYNKNWVSISLIGIKCMAQSMIWVLPHLHTCCRFCIFGLQCTRSGYRNSTFRIILCSGNRRLWPILVITITSYICTFRVNWDYVIALCIECSNNFYTDCCEN